MSYAYKAAVKHAAQYRLSLKLNKENPSKFFLEVDSEWTNGKVKVLKDNPIESTFELINYTLLGTEPSRLILADTLFKDKVVNGDLNKNHFLTNELENYLFKKDCITKERIEFGDTAFIDGKKTTYIVLSYKIFNEFVSVILDSTNWTSHSLDCYFDIKNGYKIEELVGQNCFFVITPRKTRRSISGKTCDCREFLLVNRRSKPCRHLKFKNYYIKNRSKFISYEVAKLIS